MVSVPVLSNTTASTVASCSRNAAPLTRMPWRLATAMAAMEVAGAASTSALGHDATSTASMDAVLPDRNQMQAVSSSTKMM